MTFAAIRENGRTARALPACALGLAIFSSMPLAMGAVACGKKQPLIGSFDGSASVSANIWQGTALKARVDRTFDGIHVSTKQGTVANTLVLEISGGPFAQACSLDMTVASEKEGTLAKQTCPINLDGQTADAMMDGPVTIGSDNTNEMKISAGGDAPKDGGKVFFHMNYGGKRKADR